VAPAPGAFVDCIVIRHPACSTKAASPCDD
jgi:hypothetical protein